MSGARLLHARGPQCRGLVSLSLETGQERRELAAPLESLEQSLRRSAVGPTGVRHRDGQKPLRPLQDVAAEICRRQGGVDVAKVCRGVALPDERAI